MTARRRPPGLRAQLLTFLLGGLLLSHAVGIWVLSEGVGDIHPLAREKAADMFVRVFNGLEGLSPEATVHVLAGVSNEQAKFALTDQPSARIESQGKLVAIDTLQLLLGQRQIAVHACVGEVCAPPPTTGWRDGRQRMPMVLQLQRGDGRWLEATMWTEVRRRWWWLASFWLQVSLVPIFIAVAFAVGNVARPGRALVAAASQVSRGERVRPLHIEGPREIQEILQAFNKMQLRIASFIEDRTRMLAAISHDFRTPITSLRLRVELLDDAALRDPMVRTLEEMRTMVNETLDFARDDAAGKASGDADLHAMVDELMAEQRAMGNDVRWTREPLSMAPYRCRSLAIKRALGNLVDNAVRYGERARVGIFVSPDGSSIWIDVEDDGLGIPPERHEDAFTPFVRIAQNSALRHSSGSGLGLSIARSCARAHGGDVQLQQGASGGLLARLLLPL